MMSSAEMSSLDPDDCGLWCGDHHPIDVDYIAPRTIEQALAVLRDRSVTTKMIAGGQSLIPALRRGDQIVGRLLDVCRIAGLADLRTDGDVVSIGAVVNVSDFLASPVASLLPILSLACRHVGNHTIRNRATFGGTIAWCDPMAEIPLALSMLDAVVETDRRTLPVAGLTKETLACDEVILRVKVLVPARHLRYAFDEVARRPSGGRALFAAIVAIDRSSGHRRCRVGVTERTLSAWMQWPEGEDVQTFAARAISSTTALRSSSITAKYIGSAEPLITTRLLAECDAS